ncbi:spaetzle-processing enzyme [Drosophila subpulchrella]|uniref:spaetzle-processing enzyme n=1 Tax=Drosophila subpulchrella TaxID=1486046 RepID=UPI0018A1474E|nr:spaetzle-processing enzyme [Drosophila subpulchrella]
MFFKLTAVLVLLLHMTHSYERYYWMHERAYSYCQPDEECTRMERCPNSYYYQNNIRKPCNTNGNFVCCPKPALSNCQPDEQCMSLSNCTALNDVLESADMKRIKNKILQEKECGNNLYCCPKSAHQKPDEFCTRLERCQLHLQPTRNNVQKLISRHCATDPLQRFSGQRIFIFCPRPNCLPEERCLSRDKCVPLKYIIKSTEGRHASNKVLGERQCGTSRYCCPFLRNDTLNKNLLEFPNCKPDESCIPIGKCPHMLGILKNATKQVMEEIYKNKLCTLDYRRRDLEDRVYTCCPNQGNFLPMDSHRQCGQIPGSYRMSQGNELALNQFPWMAMLLYENTSESNRDRTLAPQCGGSLINNWYVLTAAHCVTKLESFTLKRVRLGEHDTRTPIDCQEISSLKKRCAPPYLEIDVKEVIFHESFYVRREFANDIALVRLEKQVRYTKEINPICVPKASFSLENLNLETAGWGVTENGPSHVLMHSTIWENKTYCKDIKKMDFEPDQQICAGGQHKRHTCRGDSGGPLMVTKTLNGFVEYVYVVGITSFGFHNNTCGEQTIPTIFTRTGAYFNWIRKHLEP